MKMFKYLALVTFTFSLDAAQEFDLRKGVDLTATNRVTWLLINQMMDAGTISATNKGGVIRQATTPDMSLNTRYTNFIYVSNSTVTSPTLMLWNGTGWVPGLVGANTVGSSQLQDSSVTAGKLAGSSVFGTNIAGNTIQNTNLADGSVSGNKIAGGGVYYGKFAFGAIVGGDITNKTITETNIADGTVGSIQIGSGQLSNINYAASSITFDKIANSAISQYHISNSAIGTLQITNGAVTSNQIASGTINYTLIDTNTPVMVGFGSYTNSSGAGTATLLNGRNVSVARVAAGRVLVTFNTAPSSINYTVNANAIDPDDNSVCIVTNKLTTTFEIRTMNLAGALSDANQVMFTITH